MDTLRKRTFVVDIHGIRKLKDEEIYEFLAQRLKLKPENVVSIQIDRIEGKVYVETPTQKAAESIVDRYSNKFEINSNGTTHTIGLYIEDGGTDIKLPHLPPKMPDDWIYEFFAEYGKVMHLKHEKCRSKYFSNTPSGVRIIRLQMQRPVPSFISIKGYSTQATYTNQIQTCRHCNQLAHFGKTCGENRKDLKSGSSSYAGVVQSGGNSGGSTIGGPNQGANMSGKGGGGPTTGGLNQGASTSGKGGGIGSSAIGGSSITSISSGSSTSEGMGVNLGENSSEGAEKTNSENNYKRPAEDNLTTNRDKAAKTTTDDAVTDNTEPLNPTTRASRASTTSGTGETIVQRLRSLSSRSRSNSNTRQQGREKQPMDVSEDESSATNHNNGK